MHTLPAPLPCPYPCPPCPEPPLQPCPSPLPSFSLALAAVLTQLPFGGDVPQALGRLSPSGAPCHPAPRAQAPGCHPAWGPGLEKQARRWHVLQPAARPIGTLGNGARSQPRPLATRPAPRGTVAAPTMPPPALLWWSRGQSGACGEKQGSGQREKAPRRPQSRPGALGWGAAGSVLPPAGFWHGGLPGVAGGPLALPGGWLAAPWSCRPTGPGHRHAVRLWADLEALCALWITAWHFSRRSSLLFSKKPSLRGTP